MVCEFECTVPENIILPTQNGLKSPWGGGAVRPKKLKKFTVVSSSIGIFRKAEGS